MTGRVAAILLAAGKSRRMGSCKQLLPLGGSTVIGCCLDTLVMAGIAEIVVVVSPEGQEVAEAVQRYPARIVVNPHADADMASSVMIGRDAVSPESSGVIVALCDYPLVLPSTIEKMVRQHSVSLGRIIQPNHDCQRGHPLLFPRAVLDELAERITLRELVRQYFEEICHLEVDDAGILYDMDTPEDYRRLKKVLADRDMKRMATEE